MKKTELQEIADLLANSYGSGRHYEITTADRINDGWSLSIKRVEVVEDDDEGAENESGK